MKNKYKHYFVAPSGRDDSQWGIILTAREVLFLNLFLRFLMEGEFPKKEWDTRKEARAVLDFIFKIMEQTEFDIKDLRRLLKTPRPEGFR
jgi:hypothetical protein